MFWVTNKNCFKSESNVNLRLFILFKSMIIYKFFQ